jgi:hypothetical protein
MEGKVSVDRITREEAVDLLARKLHFKTEHLDPTEDPTWESLSVLQKEFYRTLFPEQIPSDIALDITQFSRTFGATRLRQ